MSEQTCIIVGASHAGVSLALALRKEGWSGSIKLISAENELPYHRPPLSKEHLSGDKALEHIRLRPQKIYDDNNIELLLGTTVLSLDAENKSVRLSDGSSLRYDRLALCTGATVRKLPLGEDLDRVLYIRTATDVGQLQRYLPEASHAVIVGGGYIGLEAAAVLRKQGIEVTIVEMEDRILARVTGPVISEYMTSLHMMHGVSIRTNTRVTNISAVDESGSRLLVSCGESDAIEADLVLVGIGVDANTTLAEQAGLEVDDGVMVDATARTSVPSIYAAGDCTRHVNPVYDKSLRLESVQNANDQARVAAVNICGKRVEYETVPWFWSDQYDIKLQMAGLSEGYDEMLVRGDPASDEEGFAVFYKKAGRLIAADCVRRPKEFMISRQLIASASKIDSASLQDEDKDPGSWS